MCYAAFDHTGIPSPPVNATLTYALLSAGEWQAEEVCRGDLRVASSATLARNSSDQPHIVLELMPSHSAEGIYDSVYHIWRE